MNTRMMSRAETQRGILDRINMINRIIGKVGDILNPVNPV